MKLGIVGLPNVGKSTLFNALTKAGAECANYPFCTIEPNIGVVSVPDYRLEVLAKMFNPQKIVPATIKFVDIAGLVKGASKGEGLGNKFLSHIREVDAIVHVVRCFEDPNITHVNGSIDPLRDIETVNFELIFADLETLEKRIEKTKKAIKSGEKKLQIELEILEKAKENLEKGIPVRSIPFNPDESEIINQLFLLTSKPVLYVANIPESQLPNFKQNYWYQKLLEHAAKEGSETIAISAKLEEEITQLPEEDKKAFLQEVGLEQSGLERLIQTGYKTLGLISFLTAGPQEVRAWTIKKGTKAPEAAGKIHSDMERGFIRAEVISFDQLIECGSMTLAKEKGLVRSEGREYEIQDGDVVLFRFNV